MAIKIDWEGDRLAVGDRVQDVETGVTGILARESFLTSRGVRSVRVVWDGYTAALLAYADRVVRSSR